MGKAGPVNVRIADIELDTSIQCRAKIDTGTVNEYAQRMSEGDKFPPVDLFESDGRYWIGDGWHRVLAVIETSGESIAATAHPGGRTAALMHALSANAVHGQRRTNDDKRRCVEIALREFPKSSARAIADLCGVSADFVARKREVSSDDTCVTGKDGKTYKRGSGEKKRGRPKAQVPTDHPSPPPPKRKHKRNALPERFRQAFGALRMEIDVMNRSGWRPKAREEALRLLEELRAGILGDSV